MMAIRRGSSGGHIGKRKNDFGRAGLKGPLLLGSQVEAGLIICFCQFTKTLLVPTHEDPP